MTNSPARELLRRLRAVLHDIGETSATELAASALADDDDVLETFIVSNSLWGGTGSISDQAGIIGTERTSRRKVEAALIALGQ